MPLEENLVAAAEACKKALEYTPGGSSNKGQAVSPVGGKTTTVTQMRTYATERVNELRAKLTSAPPGGAGWLNTIMHRAAAARTKGVGNCVDQSAIAFSLLYQTGVRPLDFMKFNAVGFDHCWVVIGRAGTATANLNTWGADAVWCDPWAAPGGLNFSVAGLVSGLTIILNHNFSFAIPAPQLANGTLLQALNAGNPQLLYRAAG